MLEDFDMANLGDLHYYLGLEFWRDSG